MAFGLRSQRVDNHVGLLDLLLQHKVHLHTTRQGMPPPLNGSGSTFHWPPLPLLLQFQWASGTTSTLPVLTGHWRGQAIATHELRVRSRIQPEIFCNAHMASATKTSRGSSADNPCFYQGWLIIFGQGHQHTKVQSECGFSFLLHSGESGNHKILSASQNLGRGSTEVLGKTCTCTQLLNSFFKGQILGFPPKAFWHHSGVLMGAV